MDNIQSLLNCPFQNIEDIKKAFLQKDINIGVDINSYTRDLAGGGSFGLLNLLLSGSLISSIIYPIIIGKWWLIFISPLGFCVGISKILFAGICFGLILLLSLPDFGLIVAGIGIVGGISYRVHNEKTKNAIIQLVITNENIFCQLWDARFISIKDKSGKIFMSQVD